MKYNKKIKKYSKTEDKKILSGGKERGENDSGSGKSHAICIWQDQKQGGIRLKK